MGGRETSMCERDIDWLPLTHPLLGTWPATQACAGIEQAYFWFSGWRSIHGATPATRFYYPLYHDYRFNLDSEFPKANP